MVFWMKKKNRSNSVNKCTRLCYISYTRSCTVQYTKSEITKKITPRFGKTPGLGLKNQNWAWAIDVLLYLT